MKGTVDELTSTEVGRPDQDTRCERLVSQSVGPDGLSFSIGARASSPRGLRDGLSSCLVVLLASSSSEKKRSGQAGLLVPKAATTARESLKHPPFRHL